MSPPEKMKCKVESVDPSKLAIMHFLHDPTDLSLPLTQSRIKVYAMIQQGYARNHGDGYVLTKKGEDQFCGANGKTKCQQAIDLMTLLPEQLLDKILIEYAQYLTQYQTEEAKKLERIALKKKLNEHYVQLQQYLMGTTYQPIAQFTDLFEIGAHDPKVAKIIARILKKINGVNSVRLREEAAEKYPMIIDHDPEMTIEDDNDDQ
jgi:hypothetical protein